VIVWTEFCSVGVGSTGGLLLCNNEILGAIKVGNLLSSLVTISFLRTLLHRVSCCRFNYILVWP
jgi:hypothetical protein